MAFLAHGGGPAVTVLRWVARAASIPLFLLWGAFFVEHSEIFADPRAWRAVWPMGLMALHAAILLGLAAGWRWELAGALVSVVASAAFFGSVARPHQVWLFIGVTSLPGLLWLACAALTAWRGPAPTPAAP